jgi:hypothetical protein
MDFKKHLEDAWALALKFIAPLIVMTLVMFLVWFFSLGILVPVTTAGYIQSLLLAVRENRVPSVKDLFSQMELFLPLLGFFFITMVVVIIGSVFFLLPGILAAMLISFACLYVLPLMTDKQLGLVEAIKVSYQIAVQKPILDHVVIVIIFFGIAAIGNSIFIGALFTQPLATLFLMSVFEEKSAHISTPEAEPAVVPESSS